MENSLVGDQDISMPESDEMPDQAGEEVAARDVLFDEVFNSADGPGSGIQSDSSPSQSDYLPETSVTGKQGALKEVTMPEFQGDLKALNKLFEDVKKWLDSLDPRLLFLLFNIGLFDSNEGSGELIPPGK